MENLHDSNHSANNGEFERGQEDHRQQPGNSSPEPLGVPDAWMEHLRDGDYPEQHPPEEPPEEFYAQPEEPPEDLYETPEEPPEDLHEPSPEVLGSSTEKRGFRAESRQEPPALQKGPQGASSAQSSLDLIHQLLDQLSVQVKAQEWVLKQLQREDYLRGDYRVERYQQIWEPLHRSDSLKEQIFQLEEQGVRLPLNDLAEKVLSAAPRVLNPQWVLEEWLKQINLYLNQTGNDDFLGEDSSI